MAFVTGSASTSRSGAAVVARAARYLWALPNTLIGLVFIPAALGHRGGMQVVDGVLELHGPIIAAVLTHAIPIRGGAAAITFGHIVAGRSRELLETLRRHERVHVRQCERWGPAFIPAYLLAGAWALVHGRGAYEGNYFERQARDAERHEALVQSRDSLEHRQRRRTSAW